MHELIWLVPALPLLGVLLNGFLVTGRPHSVQKRVAGPLAALMVGVAFALAIGIGLTLKPGEVGGFHDVKLADWINLGEGSINVPLALRVDPLSVMMMLVVTGVGFLIHVFSIGYMADDPRVGRFFVYLNLFTFAMLLLVLANNFVLMFVGWEGVGLCSYLLIGFYFEKVSAAQAGKKAFLVNRIGDFGFLLGLFAIFWFTGSLTFYEGGGNGALQLAADDTFKYRLLWGFPAVTVISLLLFVGATGKSAQLPLYLWLPDAMEGPTPVSALIHAATMVTAGVYMVARCAALFGQSAVASAVVAWVGVITALYAAIIAMRQYDIKRVLAYSTVSQLGYMFVGVGVGAYAAGVSHLVTHAFFKALMFLGAGAAMHALDGQLDMRKMGNLRKYLPVTFATFTVGWLAIIGFPFLSGFFSKDYVLESALHAAETNPALAPIFWLGILTAGLTAFYMTRMYVTTFLGSERIEMGDEGHGAAHDHDHGHDAHGHGHAHDSHGHGKPHVHPEQKLMNAPLIVLAVASVAGGVLIVPALYDYLAPVTADMVPHAHGEEGHHGGPFKLLAALAHWSTWVSVGAAALGAGIAWFGFGPEKFAKGWATGTDKALGFLQNSYEGLCYLLVVRFGDTLSQFLYSVVDRLMIDRLVEAAAYGTAGLAESLRTLQTGYVRNYALVLLAGSVFVIACFMLILQGWTWMRWENMLPILGVIVAIGVLSSFFGARRDDGEATPGAPPPAPNP
jgi:NADH-quinone oxidoreductase subunit L